MGVLSGSEIRRRISQEPPLVEGFIDLDEQVQANGFDLTLRDVSVMQSAGRVTAISMLGPYKYLRSCVDAPFGAGAAA